jgi:type VII secretion integral membrane protein EccD
VAAEPHQAVLRAPGAAIAMCRVTIVTPRKRIDVAVPSELPLGHILPNILTTAGEHGHESIAMSIGWVLQRVGGRGLDLDASLNALGVLDGEVLYLLPRPSELPEAVFDDVADTIATGIKEHSGRWQPKYARTMGLGAGVALLVAGALALTASGPPWPIPMILAGVMALVLLGAGGVLSRTFGDGRAGAFLGYAALPYTFLAGLLAPAGQVGLLWFGAPNLLAGFAMTALVTAIAAWTIVDGLPNFFGIMLAALAGAAGAAVVMVWGLPAAGVSALLASIVLSCTPLIPTLSFRLARLPLPSAPQNAEELRNDNQDLDGTDIKRKAVEAERFTSGFCIAIALTGLITQLLLLGAQGWPGTAMEVALSLALMMRARVFLGTVQRIWLMAAGIGGIVIAALSGAWVDAGAALMVAPALFGGAVVCVGMGLFLQNRRPSPFWGRAGDFVEFTLIVALFPLALAVLDVYTWVRGLAG